MADRALARGLDVIVDDVAVEELPLAIDLARRHGAQLRYAVLTASESEIRQRLEKRGDPDLLDRSLFLKSKQEAMPENQGHLLDTTGKSVEEIMDALGNAAGTAWA